MAKGLPKVYVILSAFNGERYIEAQIKSILNQTYKNLRICIRDDLSTDNTLVIIKRLAYHNEKIQIIESSTNLGLPQSFYEILRICDDADYYAFADQDDIWHPDKIHRAVEFLEKEKNSKPVLYCSSFGYYNEDGMLIRKHHLPDHITIYNSLFYTPSLGFTLVFNDTLRKMGLKNMAARSSRECGELHDRRFVRIATLFGKVICDNSITTRHIRHQQAVTKDDSSNINLLIGWVKNELLDETEIKQQKAGINNFLHDFNSKLNDHDKYVLRFFVSNKNRLRKVFYPHRFRSRVSSEFLLRLLFLIGKA